MKKFIAIGAALTMSLGFGAVVAVDQANAAPQVAVVDSANNYPVLKSGARGTQVQMLQYLLRAHGHQVDTDSAFGPKTQTAVKAFQSKKGLKVDGVVGPNTWTKLLFVTKQGNRGEAVKALQVGLNANGYSLKVDGSFGAGTLMAVQKFQDKRGLDVDGIVGPNTWGALLGVKSSGETGIKDNGSTKSPGPDTRYPNPRNFPNGKMPADQLCQVPGSKSSAYKMSCRAVKDFAALNNAYKAKFGVNLRVDHDSNPAYAYRTLAQQQATYRKFGSPRAAKPGTSKHGWGIALDLDMRRGKLGYHQSPTYKWLNENAPKYGFDDTVPHEDWHWQYTR